MHLERRTKKRFISPPNTLPVEGRAVIGPFQEIPSSSSSKPAGINCCAGCSGYGNNRTVITDIHKVLSLKKPEEREYLEPRGLLALDKRFWFFNPLKRLEAK
ncbi:MAG: hypothetical protein NTX62_01170 [Deltaproteobacteria bacterium]|nr:hypothetical protein [Deltaproteobacteria bacterium]